MYKNWSMTREKYLANENNEVDEYRAVADWCNASQEAEEITDRYHIEEFEEDGEVYYKTVQETPPTEEELAAQIRMMRDDILKTVIDPIVTNPLRWNDLSEEQQENYKAYRKYLLDLPQSEDFPNVNILTMEEFLK